MPARLRWSSSASAMLRSGCVAQPPDRLGRVPVRAEQVRAEMADQRVLLRGRDERELVQVEADRDGVADVRAPPGSVCAGPAVPALARAERPPRAVHPQVAVQRVRRLRAAGRRAQPQQQVLAADRALRDRPAGQVDGGQRGYAEVGSAITSPASAFCNARAWLRTVSPSGIGAPCARSRRGRLLRRWSLRHWCPCDRRLGTYRAVLGARAVRLVIRRPVAGLDARAPPPRGRR